MGLSGVSICNFFQLMLCCIIGWYSILLHGWYDWSSLQESIPRLFNGGRTTMTTRCAPACSQALTFKALGVWARGIEAWAWSRDSRNLEFRRWGSSGPSSLMVVFVRVTIHQILHTSTSISFSISGISISRISGIGLCTSWDKKLCNKWTIPTNCRDGPVKRIVLDRCRHLYDGVILIVDVFSCRRYR